MSGKLPLKLIVTATIVLAIWVSTTAQDCAPPLITANSKIYNIFSPEQEMILGELNYERMAGDLRFIRDKEIEAYLNALGQKLVKHMPATGLTFQFHIVDIPDANAFNTPGGYVFVSRKLIGFVNNEDELAGVVAHELGHATVRHAARDFSNYLKQILNVTQVGDRKDITDKYNLLIERERTKSISRSTDHESAQQLEADRIGLFAMVAAGYDPNAFTGFYDRLVETKGKTGSWFSDLFGKVKPEQKRLREMIKVTEQLPAQCRENRQAAASDEFLNWQADVVSYRESARAEQLSGLMWRKDLKPGLRSDISHFAISPDGKHILAQDDFAITILNRDPLAIDFQITATEARDAVFTPDSEFVVFGTEGLRFEKWSIAEKRPVEVRELVVRRDCWEHEFSPDGKFLTCIDFDLNLNVLETKTGKKVWEKKNFYELNYFEIVAWISALASKDSSARRGGFFNIEYSPDGQYLLVARSSHFRFTFKINSMTVARSENTAVALDLSSLKPLNLGGDVKKVSQHSFVFLDSNRILGMPSNKLDDSGIFSFPDGKRQAKFMFGAQELIRTGDSNYIIIKPLSNAKLGIFDVGRNEIVNGMNKVDATVWQNHLVFEGSSGVLVLTDFTFNAEKKGLEITNTRTIDIPAAAIGSLNVSEISDNFQWLAISSKTRGGLWNMSSGDRKVYVRGFRGAVVSNNGSSIGDFPKLDNVNHSLVLLNPNDGTVNIAREMPESGAQLYGRFILIREPLKAVKTETDNKSDKNDKTEEGSSIDDEGKSGDASLNRNVRMTLRDIVTDKVVWTRDFPGAAPEFYFDKFSGRLIFYWTLGSGGGKDRLRDDPALATRAQKMGNKDDDYLLEVVDAFASKTIGSVLLETGKGSFDISSAYSEGNWLVLHDSTNRILVFTVTDGELQQRFFGNTAAINPSRNQIAVENYPGELTVYNLGSGERDAQLVLRGSIAFVRFSLDGKRLFVLTDRQVAYAFDVDKLVVKTGSLAAR